MIALVATLIPFFLCWGSFLNVVAYRLMNEVSFIRPRSYCPHCRHTLAWYDLVPLLSWCVLKGSCRHCHGSISFLYPLVEFLTACIMCALFVCVPLHYFFSYFIFFSALIVTIRSDLETMMISRFVTLFLVPLGFLFSALHLLPLSLAESITAALFGFGVLFVTGKLFFLATKKEGMGQGDVDLLAFIGSFLGFYGCWISLLLGSLFGSIIGITYMTIKKTKQGFKIPFGPFLALGAIFFVLFKPYVLSFLFKHSC